MVPTYGTIPYLEIWYLLYLPTIHSVEKVSMVSILDRTKEGPTSSRGGVVCPNFLGFLEKNYLKTAHPPAFK